jgi:hypothetical protein
LIRTVNAMTAVIGEIPASRRARIPGAVVLLARRAADHAKATAARLSGSVLTAAGLGCIDTGAFTANTVVGWIVTGLSVLVLDWKLEQKVPGVPGSDRMRS